MRQIVQVKKILDENHAEVFLERPSACGGNCHDCGGCGGDQKRIVIATARNLIGARVGDQVYVEADTKRVFSVILLVYLVPLILFLAGYALGVAMDLFPLIWGCIGFAAGMYAAIRYNRHVERKKLVSYRITAFA